MNFCRMFFFLIKIMAAFLDSTLWLIAHHYAVPNSPKEKTSPFFYFLKFKNFSVLLKTFKATSQFENVSVFFFRFSPPPAFFFCIVLAQTFFITFHACIWSACIDSGTYYRPRGGGSFSDGVQVQVHDGSGSAFEFSFSLFFIFMCKVYAGPVFSVPNYGTVNACLAYIPHAVKFPGTCSLGRGKYTQHIIWRTRFLPPFPSPLFFYICTLVSFATALISIFSLSFLQASRFIDFKRGPRRSGRRIVRD